jgi:predicted DNA-binding protein
MANVKMTFSLDEETAARIDRAAATLHKPKSAIVREAILDYAHRVDRLSESERLRLLAVFDEVVAAIPDRPRRDVDDELAEVRRARRRGGRGSVRR